MIDSILAYDATGGGLAAVVPPTSLTIKGPSTQEAYIVAYAYDGISASNLVITCATNPDWEAVGFNLPPTGNGTAIAAGDAIRSLAHKIKVRGGDVLVLTTVSGANPVHVVLWIDYPPFSFQMRNPAEQPAACYASRATVAGGTNCAAGTIVQGATNVGGFLQGRTYSLIGAAANGAFTTTAFLGLRKLGSNYMLMLPIPLTNVAQLGKQNIQLAKGIFPTVTQGDQIEVLWSSVTAEQPTATILFAYA